MKRLAFIHRITFVVLALVVLTGCSRPTVVAPLSSTITADELSRRIDAGDALYILDVRTVKEFNAGHIEGAVCIPHDQVADRLDELPSDKSQEIIFYCRSERLGRRRQEVVPLNR